MIPPRLLVTTISTEQALSGNDEAHQTTPTVESKYGALCSSQVEGSGLRITAQEKLSISGECIDHTILIEVRTIQFIDEPNENYKALDALSDVEWQKRVEASMAASSRGAHSVSIKTRRCSLRLRTSIPLQDALGLERRI